MPRDADPRVAPGRFGAPGPPECELEPSVEGPAITQAAAHPTVRREAVTRPGSPWRPP